ncbi:hypothetical protein LTR08_003001 [Meristemomyces frigidus]|nr:hypothetical protein LTR08_003001 [Meristemomyces frigidus]
MSTSVTPQRRRRRVEDVDGEEDFSIDGDGSDRHSTPKRIRRPHRNEDSPNGPLLPNSFRRSPQGRAPAEHAPAKYQPGSIVRVKLTNFVTYTSAEFHPGPSLNMIIGPNGTGKSTLVCAICLGLGSPPALLGRAKEISEFIKHGANKAEIEIELAADPARHETNPVVTAKLNRTSKKPEFLINGNKVTKKELEKLMRSFSIQIGNLCQFLPQDRVVEFAALSPVNLLVQTQQAVASPQMCEWHEELKVMRKEEKDKETQKKTIAEHLENLEKRQNGQEADVARLRERQGLQEDMAAMDKLRPFSHYMVAQAHYKEAKKLSKLAAKELQRLTNQLEPNLEAEEKKQAYAEKIEKVATSRGHVIERTETLVATNSRKHEDKAQELKVNAAELESEKKLVKATRQDIPRLQKSVTDLERTMQGTPPDSDFTVMNEQIRERHRIERDLGDHIKELREKKHSLGAQMEQQERIIGIANQEKAESQTQAGQQANKLRNINQQAHKAWEWIKRNQNLFRGKVFGPPIVECSVTDPRHAAAVESVIGQGDLVAFTVTSREDFKTLNHQLYTAMQLTDINLRTVNTPLANFRPPCSVEQLRTYGMDSYILNLMEGPDEVLAMLCDNRNIHQTAFTSRDLSQQDIDVLSRPNSPITSWVTPKDKYQITRRREYGDKATSTRVQALQPAKVFLDAPASHQEDADLERRVTDARRTIHELEGQIEDTKRELGEVEQRAHKAVRERKEFQTTKNAIQTRLSEFNALPAKLEEAKRKRRNAEEKVATSANRQFDLVAAGDKLTLEKGQVALDYGNSVEALQKLHISHLEALILAIEAKSDYEQLQARTTEEKQQLETHKRELKDLEQRAKRALEDGMAWQAKCRALNDPPFTELEQRIYDLQREEEWDPDRVETEIQSLQARLDMTDGVGNQHTLREFEHRAKQIDEKRVQVAQLTAALEELETRIRGVRGEWEPQLDGLIEQISAAFAENFGKIQCAGEVGLVKTEDFEDWAVQIRVKFRESEALSPLDAHRQSGGERAVSTIFYLMALQSLARAPFRVVDEINQGMDPRNERLVHSRMVDIACGAQSASQYFLITPKLLGGLRYVRGMRVHCIASGEGMPGGEVDFGGLARRALEVKAGGG